jgi:hypothetical protein
MRSSLRHQHCNRTVFTVHKGIFTDSNKRSKYKRVKPQEICRDKLVDSIAQHYYKRLFDNNIATDLGQVLQSQGKPQLDYRAGTSYKISRAPLKYYLTELQHKRQEKQAGLARQNTAVKATQPLMTELRRPHSTKSLMPSKQTIRAPGACWESPYHKFKRNSVDFWMFESLLSTPSSNVKTRSIREHRGISALGTRLTSSSEQRA